MVELVDLDDDELDERIEDLEGGATWNAWRR